MSQWLRLVLVAVILATTASIATANVIVPRLVGGRPTVDRFGELIDYVIFAEEKAVVNPPPAFAFFNGETEVPLTERVIPFNNVPNPPRLQLRINSSSSYTRSLSPNLNVPTRTVQIPQLSFMEWSLIGMPADLRLPGQPTVSGRRSGIACEGDRFILRDLIFPLRGVYNIEFNATLFSGEHVRFNRTIRVDQQPEEVLLVQQPIAYNGSFFQTAPEAQLAYFLRDRGNARTNTATVTLIVNDAPTGAQVTGVQTLASDSEGNAKFSTIICSLPGRYLFQFNATLSDGSFLISNEFAVVVIKALATRIVNLEDTYGVSRFQFFNQPRFQIYDQAGLIEDDRTNITVSLQLNAPSITYAGLNTLSSLKGTLSATPVNYTYAFTDLEIDLPGNYELLVILWFDDNDDGIYDVELLSTVVPFQVANSPTFEVQSPLGVNTEGAILFYGSRPVSSLVTLRLSNDAECSSAVSQTLVWPEENPPLNARNITFIPYTPGDEVFVCMGLPTQTAMRPLVQHYLPRFNELFPFILNFPIRYEAECQPITEKRAKEYRTYGWDTATGGRLYGCNLEAPSQGTVAPCECPWPLACAEMRHPVFTPPDLDIGLCMCCNTLVMTLAGLSVALFLVILLFVVYMYV